MTQPKEKPNADAVLASLESYQRWLEMDDPKTGLSEASCQALSYVGEVTEDAHAVSRPVPVRVLVLIAASFLLVFSLAFQLGRRAEFVTQLQPTLATTRAPHDSEMDRDGEESAEALAITRVVAQRVQAVEERLVELAKVTAMVSEAQSEPGDVSTEQLDALAGLVKQETALAIRTTLRDDLTEQFEALHSHIVDHAASVARELNEQRGQIASIRGDTHSQCCFDQSLDFRLVPPDMPEPPDPVVLLIAQQISNSMRPQLGGLSLALLTSTEVRKAATITAGFDRYVLYNHEYFQRLHLEHGTELALAITYLVIGHELGHVLLSHVQLGMSANPGSELSADYFAGRVLRAAEVPRVYVLRALETGMEAEEVPGYPSAEQRHKAVLEGYASGQNSRDGGLIEWILTPFKEVLYMVTGKP